MLGVSPRTYRRKLALLVAGVGVMTALNGCGLLGVPKARIQEVLTRPRDFLGREVLVEGVVADSVRLGSLVNSYWIDDKTGKIRVSAQRPVPLPGARVIVRAHVDC